MFCFRYKLDLLLQPSGPDNFISTHCGFVSPSYVLQNNVTLYYITPNEAVFVESKEDVDVMRSDNGAFLRAAQFQNARRIITLPISSFHKLAEEIGDPQAEIVFLGNVARCGSTLMCQIFEESGCCVAYGEPDALNAIAMYDGKLPQSEFDALAKNCVRMLCKPQHGRNVSAFMMKPSGVSSGVMSELHRLFPQSKCLFMYRDGLAVSESMVRIAAGLPTLQMTYFLMNLHPRLTQMAFEGMGLPAKGFNVKLQSPLSFGCMIWAMLMRMYLDFRKNGLPISGVRYEDIISHPRESTAAIFKYCGIPEALAEKAINALSKDSQRGSPLSRKSLSKERAPALEGDNKVEADAICDKFTVPRLSETYIAEGTITCREK